LQNEKAQFKLVFILFFFDGSLELEPIFFDLGMQGGPGKAKELCRLRSISAGEVKRFANDDSGKPIHAVIKAFFIGL